VFGWVFALVYFFVLLAVQNWWDRTVPRVWRYDPVRKWRSGRLWLFVKIWIIVSIPCYFVGWMIGGRLWNTLCGTFFAILILWIAGEISLRVILGALHPAQYQMLARDGWDCFFDTWWMGIVNRDPPEVTAGKPPLCLMGSNWAPPAAWTERCPSCGAAQPGPMFWCWHCGLGFENGRQKMCCPHCDTTFVNPQPGAGLTAPVTCPGCGTAWQMPG
jgi:hypothetical protein